MDPGTQITLPGGVLIGERLAREAQFRPLSGRLEETLAQLAEEQTLSRPARVSALLAAALAQVGGRDATRSLVAGLGTTDRQFLLLALALEHAEDEQWRHLDCAACGGRFDVGFRISALPLTPAAPGYPWAGIDAAGRRLRLRVPTGEDEERIAGMAPAAGLRALALGCVVSLDDAPATPAALEALGEDEVNAIDAALEAAAPQLATTLATACSECGAARALEIDPYDMALPQADALYHEVHALAARYHWGESEILALPRERRRRYLELSDELSAAHR